MSNVKPIIKWAGGKRKLAPTISNIAKEDLSNCDTYIEPFFGGGAVYFDLYNNQFFKNAYVNDIVPQLVSFYKTIAQIDNVEEIHTHISDQLNKFNALDSKEERQNFFYDVRNNFNNLWVNEDPDTPTVSELNAEDSIHSAILLYVLNRTCFNGLFRVNKKGGFNVPLGSYKTIAIPTLDEIENYSRALNNTEIFLGDYEKLIDKSNSFLYPVSYLKTVFLFSRVRLICEILIECSSFEIVATVTSSSVPNPISLRLNSSFSRFSENFKLSFSRRRRFFKSSKFMNSAFTSMRRFECTEFVF